MILEIGFALFAGIFFGTFTGIFPGIHINLVAAGLLALIASGKFSGIEGFVFVAFIVALAIAHTMIDFIPSIFLGAPDDESYLAVLPGHDLLNKGRGFDAVVATLSGGILALPFLLIFSFIYIIFLNKTYDFVYGVIPFILIFVSCYLIFREKETWKAIAIFLMAGVFGLLTLNLPVREPLLPMLTGLFGISSLIVSLKDKVKIKEQSVGKIRFPDFKNLKRTILSGGFVAPLFSFLPAIGGGQASVIASEVSGKEEKDSEAFLFLVGMINVIVMGLSFVTLFVLGKGRTGAAAAVGEILGEFGVRELVWILIIILISTFISFFIGIYIGRFFARNISKINYGKISVFVIIILFCINLILTNWVGIIVLITGSALGVLCILTGARRINLMGCLLLPTIVYYLGL